MVPLAPLTSWLVGGPAEYFAEPTDQAELEAAIRFALKNRLQLTVLGGGTNVLIDDAGIKGMVIALRKFSGLRTRVEGDRFVVEALAGTSKSELLKCFLKAKLEPALFLAGIPGDLGGGIVMNAGVSEKMLPREFVEIVESIEVLRWPNAPEQNESTGLFETIVLKKSDLQWGYRHCEGWRPGIITKATLSWRNQPRADVLERVRSANQLRLTKQPLDKPSCGSVFVNPEGNSAGRLIEASGLKGYSIGGAQVSTKHANFIVNTGSARAADIRKLIDHVRATVLAQHGIALRTEVIFLA